MSNLCIAYNKWHETELERWLSDNDVPYPAPADRKDLENLVKENWQAKVVDPIAETGEKVDDHYGGIKNWIFDSYAFSCSHWRILANKPLGGLSQV